MSNNTGQTTKVNTHLVNFGQHYQCEPSNIIMNKLKTEHDNIVQNIPKVGTVYTQPKQYAEAGTNTILPSNRFTQTQPIQHYEAATNTNLPSIRLTNTPRQNNISTHNDSCKCEEEEMNLEYKSNFARQLQQSEAIPNVQPVTNYNSERPRQTESSTIYHIPQESISHTQPPAIQYTQQPVTNYNSERPRQT